MVRTLCHVMCVVGGDWSECSVPATFIVAAVTTEIHDVNRRDVTGL